MPPTDSIERAVVVAVALLVGILAILYRLALTGNHPPLTTRLRGVRPERTESRSLRVLLLAVAYAAGLYAVFVFGGVVHVPTSPIQWSVVVAVGIAAVVLLADGLLP